MCCTHLHNYIPTQNSTVFTHIEWEPVNWHRLTDGPTHPPPTLCNKPAVRNALLVIKPHWRKISTQTNFSVMELLIKKKNRHLQVLVFKVVTYSIINGVSVFVCTCMVFMCCVWCPCVVTAVLSSLFLFWSYFTTVVLHSLVDTWCTQRDLRTISTLWPFFPLLLIYFNDLQLPTITYQHRIAQYLHIEWEPVLWQRPIDGPPPTPCDKPTVRKALLGLKSHRRWISKKNQFHCHGTVIKNTWKHKCLQVLVFKVLICTHSHRLLCDHIYMYMLNVGITRSTHLH